MNKFKSFFGVIGSWLQQKGIAIGKWFKNWVVPVDGKDIIPVRIGRWFKYLFVAKGEQPPQLLTAVRSEGSRSAMASVVAILLGLLGGLLVMIIVNPANAFGGFSALLQGKLNMGMKGIGDILFYATPLLLTGLSVGFAFKTGLFNIGATGQFTMGLFFSVYCGFFVSGNWVVCILAGMLGGAIWGLIPGLFKALFNINEVITSIMTNYISMYLVDALVKSIPTIYDFTYGTTKPMPESTNIPKWGLDSLFGSTYINGGIIIAIVIAIVMLILLNKTKLGYELKACGMNKDAAKYAGINQNMRIVMAMVIAGALAGIGGAMFIQNGLGNVYYCRNSLLSYGFDGIAVALLGVSNPIGAIFSAIFFAHIKQGAPALQVYGFTAELTSVIVGIIIYFSAFALFFKDIIAKLIKPKDNDANNDNSSSANNSGLENIQHEVKDKEVQS